MRTGHGESAGESAVEDALDRELRAALDVSPSPEFVARVRTEIGNQPRPARWMPWRYAVGAAAMAAVVVVAVSVTRDVNPTSNVNVPRDMSPAPTNVAPNVAHDFSRADSTNVAHDSPNVAPNVAHDFSRAVVEAAPAKASTPTSESEAVFSAAEVRAFRHLAALVNQGAPELESLLAPPPDSTPIAPIEPGEIVIAPITIEPLVSATQ